MYNIVCVLIGIYKQLTHAIIVFLLMPHPPDICGRNSIKYTNASEKLSCYYVACLLHILKIKRITKPIQEIQMRILRPDVGICMDFEKPKAALAKISKH